MIASAASAPGVPPPALQPPDFRGLSPLVVTAITKTWISAFIICLDASAATTVTTCGPGATAKGASNTKGAEVAVSKSAPSMYSPTATAVEPAVASTVKPGPTTAPSLSATIDTAGPPGPPVPPSSWLASGVPYPVGPSQPAPAL